MIWLVNVMLRLVNEIDREHDANAWSVNEIDGEHDADDG